MKIKKMKQTPSSIADTKLCYTAMAVGFATRNDEDCTPYIIYKVDPSYKWGFGVPIMAENQWLSLGRLTLML